MTTESCTADIAIHHGGPSPHQLPPSFWKWLSQNGLQNLDSIAIRSLHQAQDMLAEFADDSNPSDEDASFKWTYRQLLQAVETVATILHAKGVRKGDHICCFTSNGAEWVLLMWTSARLGAAFVPLDPSTLHRTEEMKYMQTILNPAVVYIEQSRYINGCSQAFCNSKVNIANGTDLLPNWHSFASLAKASQELHRAMPAIQSATDDIALVLFTSGSTGAPKMVPKTARNWMTEIEDYRLFAASNWSNASRLATTTNNFRPVFCIGVVTAWSVGGTVVIPSATFDTRTLLGAIATHHVTHMMAVPAALKMVIAATPSSNKIDSLLYTGVSGDIIDAKSLQEARQRLGIKRLIAAWGMTETHPVFGWTDAQETIPVFGDSVTSIGKPLPGSSAKVCYAGTTKAVCRGEKGELHIASGSLIQGYGGNRESSDFYKGNDGKQWFNTGDLAIMNESGCVFVIGRTKDIIKCKAVNLVPSIIEDYLSEKHKLDTKVIGIAHDQYGSVPIAITSSSLCAQAKTTIKKGTASYLGQDYFLSDVYSFDDLGIDEWPRNSSDKVDKQQLQKLITAKM